MSKDTFWQRLGQAFISLVRFLAVLILVAAVLAAVYFGAPALYDRYLAPIERNNAHLESLVEAQDAQIEDLQAQVSVLKERLGRLETTQTENAQTLTELQSRQDAQDKMLASIEASLQTLDVLQDQIDALNASLESQQSALTDTTAAVQDLQQTSQTLRLAQILTRARLYMAQNNYGLAAQDIGRALDSLAATPDKPPFSLIVDDLRSALKNLPEHPVVAADHLNIAWEMLLGVTPLPATPAAPTETPQATETP